MFKRNLDSKCKVQNDSIKSKNVRNKKIAIEKQWSYNPIIRK